MIVDAKKLEMALARRSENVTSLRSAVSQATLKRIERGDEVKPKQVGRISDYLGIDPSEIIA